MNDRYLIGIDNGLTGGVCFLSPKGEILSTITMPVWLPDGEKHREIDFGKLQKLLWSHAIPKNLIEIYIEKPVGAKSANAMRSMAASFATIFCAAETSVGCKDLIHRVAAKTWQKQLLPKGVDTKVAAVEKAKQLWPDEDFLASDRCRKPHLGMVDAALIAEYGRTFT